jgi:hypothetical protein
MAGVAVSEGCAVLRTGLAGLLSVALAVLPAAAQEAPKPSTVQPPGTRPSYATARCSDGTFWARATRAGACLGHGGISETFNPLRPKDATARCVDGTWSAIPDRSRACSGEQGGVRIWLGVRRPPGATGRCSDGSFWMGADLSNACPGRGGPAEWYGLRLPPEIVEPDKARAIRLRPDH